MKKSRDFVGFLWGFYGLIMGEEKRGLIKENGGG